VVHFSDSNGFGGAEQVMLQLLEGLDRARWRPVLLHHTEPGLARLVAGAQALDVECRVAPRLSRRQHLGSGLREFVRILQAERPAVFHAHLPAPLTGKYGLLAAALGRVPAVVATAHLLDDRPADWRERVSQRMVTACVDRYLAVSDGVARRLRARSGMPERKLRVIRNGVAVDRFRRPPDLRLRAELTGGREQTIVLTIARLDAQKGHVHLLAAAAEIPDALFLLAGDGAERPRLEAEARALGVADRVRFLGHRDDIPELLALCDLFVLPSLYEGLPLSVLEAMAAGRPVVATAVGGTDEAVLHGETGLLVAPGDASALRDAIRALLADPDRAARMGEAGGIRACREFSAGRMIAQVTGVYEELLDRHAARRVRA
jgi:glycosyltransferase involved in cell wall biosynthesis